MYLSICFRQTGYLINLQINKTSDGIKIIRLNIGGGGEIVGWLIFVTNTLSCMHEFAACRLLVVLLLASVTHCFACRAAMFLSCTIVGPISRYCDVFSVKCKLRKLWTRGRSMPSAVSWVYLSADLFIAVLSYNQRFLKYCMVHKPVTWGRFSGCEV